MISFRKTGDITITCHNRLAPFLAEEVKALGFTPSEVFLTGVKLTGNLIDCIKLNLYLRCASQVLFSLKKFEANDPEEVYNAAKSIEWEKMLPVNTYFTITSNVSNSTINNSMFANVKVKDAIVDRMRRKTGRRPNTGSDPEAAVFHLYWKNEQAELFIDTSGHSLGRHGYRKFPGKAPMLEALSSAVILATNWDKKSPLINPMCGSGTLAIEAALIATNRYPGLYRNNYGFMHILGYEDFVYEEEMENMRKNIRIVPNLKIFASDHSREAIKTTRLNASAADVLDIIKLETCDFEASTITENGDGIVIMNPEYGLRLGEIEELEETYSRIGNFFKKKCAGYTGYIFTGNLDLAKKIGLKPKRKIEFFNSKIDCRLFMYELYKGTKRVFTTEQP
ncbi:MAG: RNA methyltransferase [Pseudopedobacter saltans]|uniref:RNA methyltransferase n=1 Tax=Pseudopedobacter saltans TaxID=151895 RepID=A0A2W5EXV6_9SPHI|nr:MAG: RNA methyltransferase [Pseudopedobacter saltans]